jgi:tetratricopeptide (TPR) repeat protein
MISRDPRWIGWGLAGLLALLFLLGAPRIGRAQDPPRRRLTETQKRETLDRYEKATRLYNLGQYEKAIAEYQAAYLISADPVMLYNIAQCHRNNGQSEEAVRFYKSYLRNAPNAPNRPEVEKRIADMERLSAERRREAIAPSVPPVPPGPPAPAAGFPPPAPGDPPTLPLPQVPPPLTRPEMTAAAPAHTPDASLQRALATEPEAQPSRFLPVSLLVGGGTLVATSLVFGAVAVSKAKQVEEKARSGSRYDDAVRSLEKTGKAASGLALATGIVGICAAGAGTFLWLRSGPSSSSSSATVLPLTAPGLAGAAVHLRF